MRKHNPLQLRIWIPNPRLVDDLGVVHRGQSMTHLSSIRRVLGFLALISIAVFVAVTLKLVWSSERVLEHLDLENGWKGLAWGKAEHYADSMVKIDEHGVGLPEGVHAVDHLMDLAKKRFHALLEEETHSLRQAAAQYRSKRGRHPPPGFEAWYGYAIEHGAVTIEDFWDQIYHDLGPFESINPLVLRKQAHAFSSKISIRDNHIEVKSFINTGKIKMWERMLKRLTSHPHVKLPDMDIPLNGNDEPAMLIPWEDIDTLFSKTHKIMLPAEDVLDDFSGLSDIGNLTIGFNFDPEWLGPRLKRPGAYLGPRPMWSLARPACPPRSPSRVEKTFNDIWGEEMDTKVVHSAASMLPRELPDGTLKGYVLNWTQTMDVCQWPQGQGLHSAFVAPKEMAVTPKPFPLFGDSKLSISNEILLPGAKEWNTLSTIIERNITAWDTKRSKLFWRGTATSSRETKRYWQRFHRERFVSMMNATHVEIAEAANHSGNESTVGIGYASNFRLFPANDYHLKSQTGAYLAEWVNSWADVAFTDLKCEDDNQCSYFSDYFSTKNAALTEEDMSYKYAVAIDSDSGDDAGNFVQHLRSNTTTLRASVYRKSYDSRIVPWMHFVPMDNTFVDIYGIMEYFLGTTISEDAKQFPHAVGEVQKHDHHFGKPNKRDDAAHEDAARKIATAGKEWADKVLRSEDMLIYVYRLLLEYARIMDDKRDRLGWVGDLSEGKA